MRITPLPVTIYRPEELQAIEERNEKIIRILNISLYIFTAGAFFSFLSFVITQETTSSDDLALRISVPLSVCTLSCLTWIFTSVMMYCR